LLAYTSGDLRQAIAATHKVTELDPLFSGAWALLGRYHAHDGQFVEARSALLRALEMSPENTFAAANLGHLFLVEGHPQQACAAYQRVRERMWRVFGKAICRHELGQQRESQQALDELIADFQHSSAYQIAEVYAWRGDRDRAFEWLERAYVGRDAGMTSVKPDVFLRKVRSDPRYPALLKKMNLPLD
jgi:serine/threonine-protein kinase